MDELIGLYDTPAMCEEIALRYTGRDIYVYPDASGRGRQTVDAWKNDRLLLEQAGFIVCTGHSNPRVQSRITAMNSAFCNAKGERSYLVNVDKCPKYSQSLEQQVYNDNGEPDKTKGDDHPNDAGGYFIAEDYPIVRPLIHIPFKRN